MNDWHEAEAHADRALEMYQRGRWAEAESELRKALSLNPDHAEWHFNLGMTLEAAGRDADALEAFRRTVELLPDEVEPLVAAGSAAIRIGQFANSITWLDKALRLDSACEPAYAGKIEGHVRLGQHDEAETAFYMAQHALIEPSPRCFAAMAESLIQREIWERAEWCLKEALRLEPGMPRLRARLATVMNALGKPQRALHLYLKELRDDPGNIDTLLDYGDLLVELGRLPEAGEKFRRVLEIEPANVDAHCRLGHVAMAARRFEQACLEFELVQKLDPHYPGIRLALGESLLKRGIIDEACGHLRDECDAVLAAGRELQSKSGAADVNAATAEPSPETVELNPPAIARLGGLLLEMNDPVRAGDLFELALKGGETAEVLRQLALARFRSGDLDGGCAASQRVLRHDPDCVRSIHNLALAAMQRGDTRLAAGWVRRGLRINRHDGGLRRVRMRVCLARISDSWRSLFRWT